MKQIIKKGTTSKIVQIFIQDSSSTTGAGLTGLAYNSGSLTAYYRREDAGNAGGTAISLVTATLGTFSSGGFKECDSTNMPGWYELHIPNAVLATGASWATIMLKGASNMAPVVIEIQLVTYNPDDGNLGLTGLTGLTAPTAGALPTGGTGTNQINLSGGRADANVTYFGGNAGTFSGGFPETNLKKILGTTLTETSAGYLVAAFKKFFDVATPVGTINDLPGVTPGTTGGLILIGTGTRDINPNAGGVVITTTDKQAFFDFATSNLTTVGSWGKQIVDNLDAAVSSRLAPTTAGRTLDVSATGEAGLDFDNIKDATGSHTLTNITIPTVTTAVNVTNNNDKTGYGLADNAITSAKIQDGAITDAKFTVPTLSTGPATGMLGKMLQLWNYFFLKRTYDGTNLKTYAADNTTVNTTQAVGESGGVQTQGKAS